MIYLDHAAATPVCEAALTAMKPYLREKFFNPSAAYLPAKEVSREYEEAKGVIAHAIGARAGDLVMTAGATEANNLAFTVLGSNDKVLVLTTEHDSVRRLALGGGSDGEFGDADRQNLTRFLHEFIEVDEMGRVRLDDLQAKMDDSVKLVSVALVNNELGTIQPLTEVAEIIRKVRYDRMRRGVKQPIYLHTDASQAINLMNVNVARLGVDLLTMNAAKVYGPKGVGALYVGHGVLLAPISVGGGQERGLRAGTENVPGVMGFAAAINEAKEHLNGNRKKYAKWKTILLNNLRDYELINKGKTLDNFLVVSFPGLDAERLIYLLEEREVYVATGAACAASKGEKSHVLTAIHLSAREIAGSLRITLGETNNETQILAAAEIINDVVMAERERVKASYLEGKNG